MCTNEKNIIIGADMKIQFVSKVTNFNAQNQIANKPSKRIDSCTESSNVKQKAAILTQSINFLYFFIYKLHHGLCS